MEQPKESKESSVEPEVQVMSRDERDSFQGLTIEQGARQQENAGHQSGAGKSGIYVRHYNWTSTNWMTKIVIGLVLLAIISGTAVIGGALLVLFALGWLVSKIFRR